MRARRVAAVVTALVGLSWLVAVPASAQASEELTVEPSSAPAGASVHIVGAGCVAGAQVELRFDEELVGDTEADPNGRFAADVTVPAGAGVATHEISAMCGTEEGTSVFLAGSVVVELPRTGAATGTWAAVGIGLLGAGLMLWFAARPRQRAATGVTAR